VINDAAAYIAELAREHGRNAAAAESMVRDAANFGARDAAARNVVDLVAPNLGALLTALDGRKTVPKGLVLRTADARIERVEMSLWKRTLDLLIDPNIIALMLSLGLVGILVELWNPGLILPGTVGVISLIVGLYGVQVLPVSAAGLLLMLFAAALFVAEAFVVSHGALTLAGAASFVFGSLLLFDPAGPAYQVSIEVAVAIAATVGLFMALAIGKAVQVRQRPVEVGAHTLVGTTGIVRRDGLVFAAGELWHARAPAGESLDPGDEVAIDAVDGLTLDVRPVGSHSVEAARVEKTS
jgi:membrane-bound serine protease (ClpP class)